MIKEILPNESMSKYEKFEQQIELIISVEPSDALLRGTVHRKPKGSWQVDTEIGRLNEYGNQSHCIRDHILEKYCYCNDLIKNN